MAIRIQNAKHIKPEKCLPKSNIIKSLCIYVYNTKKNIQSWEKHWITHQRQFMKTAEEF